MADYLKSVSLPTLDRPFGVELWPIFSLGYSRVMGFAPEKFVFVPGVTPMSTLKATATMLITYYVTIFAGREFMKKREPLKLNGLFMMHNLGLTTISAVLLLLFIEQLTPTVWRNGVFYAICDHRGGWTAPMVTLYYLNYLTKYLELVDTLFLVVKKKPLTFLHTYHHGATALLCYTQLIGLTSVSWVPITLNLLVHVVMYWYYFQAARGVKIWWKQYITKLQILQFVIDLGFVYFASYTYFTSTYFPWLPNKGKCAGEEFAAFAGMGILSSYLLLFISFYFATYRKESSSLSTQGKKGGGKKRARSASETATKAVIDMSRTEVPGVKEVGEKMQHLTDSSSSSSVGGGSRGQSNGYATSTSTTNGGVTPRVTRSRKA